MCDHLIWPLVNESSKDAWLHAFWYVQAAVLSDAHAYPLALVMGGQFPRANQKHHPIRLCSLGSAVEMCDIMVAHPQTKDR
jgi:hypothetical protein